MKRPPAFNVLLCFCLCACMGPFIYALGFCFPRGDDFDEATRAMFFCDLPGGLYEIGREWLTWSGRYTYHFLAVFLGKAAENRCLYALVCGTVLALEGLGMHALLAGLDKRQRLELAFLFLCALCASYQNLPDFYLLTDALTICLQGALFLLFLASLFSLWNLRQNRSRWRVALCFGIAAIGVYEHAALAVMLAAPCFVFLSMKREHGHKSGGRASAFCKRLWTDPETRPFSTLTVWLFCAFLFSFLAPGNFQRKLARGGDSAIVQLQTCFQDWLDALKDFFLSPWPLTAISLALIIRRIRKPEDGENWRACAVIAAAFFIFSGSLAFLHAMSDVPLGSEPKLAASVGFYAALSLGLFCYFLPVKMRFLNYSPARRGLILILLIICFGSANFKNTLASAANGRMVQLALFMDDRSAIFAREARRNTPNFPPFGLIGEIKDANARRRIGQADGECVSVQSFPWRVFPVYMKESLADEPRKWPNKWAAWLYGLAGARALDPLPKAGKARVIPLAIPPELRKAGIDNAWRLVETPGDGINDWLVLALPKDVGMKTRVFCASPPNRLRFAPMFLQNFRYAELEKRQFLDISYFDNFAGAWAGRARFLKEGRAVFPLGLTDGDNLPPVFASPGSPPYYALIPIFKDKR